MITYSVGVPVVSMSGETSSSSRSYISEAAVAMVKFCSHHREAVRGTCYMLYTCVVSLCIHICIYIYMYIYINVSISVCECIIYIRMRWSSSVLITEEQ
jgi:hypothetical protein